MLCKNQNSPQNIKKDLKIKIVVNNKTFYEKSKISVQK